MTTKKERVDKLVVDQGLAKSRTQAQALIMAGQVCLGDQLIKKPSEMFSPSSLFRLKAGAVAKYVSRGGEKLEGALKKIGLSVVGMKALDIGQSTGGFTDCLLQAGVQEVVGLDVGHDQLDWKIRKDPRVKAFEGINARSLPSDIKDQKFDLVVIDVSFISLSLILPEAIQCLKPGGHLLSLVKPQFEVEKHQVGKGGIIKDPLLHKQVQEKIQKIAEQLSFKDIELFESSIEGTDGNKEFFIFAHIAY